MKQFTRTMTVEDRRTERKTLEEDARGVLVRLANTPDVTVDDLGKEALPLRKEDDRDAMVAAVRREAAKLTGFSGTENSDEVIEEPVAPANSETLEKLNDVEKACLESMRQDFDRGIVQIDDNADEDAYQASLKQDKTAGQSWEAVQGRLLANETALLKKAVELSQLTGDKAGKGACLVGVYENGELAIRQRSQEIVNARWNDRGELKLLFHPDAMAQESGQWAKAVEIVRAVKAAGYHVPADAGHKKKGLIAASEAVTGADYVASPNRNERRWAMLECPDDITSYYAHVDVVDFFPSYGYARVTSECAGSRRNDRGAVLWLRG
ncbi:hypothetical protein IPJ72_03160 [Candidatus Peregrinibacteria bacterium]|nr:MAG: hypothetical protein IPJ72_03160 [Candidatus Peregrinibacteria bacterium]